MFMTWLDTKVNVVTLYMRLNDNDSFDVKKMNAHQTFHLNNFLQNQLFRFLYKKMDPITYKAQSTKL